MTHVEYITSKIKYTTIRIDCVYSTKQEVECKNEYRPHIISVNINNTVTMFCRFCYVTPLVSGMYVQITLLGRLSAHGIQLPVILLIF